tara:strand:+ start:108 stop:233 length:126 start_codon:yes stop_codon:yes gene_type:complete
MPENYSGMVANQVLAKRFEGMEFGLYLIREISLKGATQGDK